MSSYELLDFGIGRKLERIGPFVLDRPEPAAEGIARTTPEIWTSANAHFVRCKGDQGSWTTRGDFPQTWPVEIRPAKLELKLTPFGHVGVFPEQAENWAWLRELIDRPEPAAGTCKVLNLFGYTGGATLAAASAGAEVVHVDAAKNTVAWARRNAGLSGLAGRPIRWIVEDAQKFVRREVRRGNRYDAVILDPPTFGHGPNGEVWRIEEHLTDLLRRCAELTDGAPKFLLCTCHTPGFTPAVLRDRLEEAGFLPASISAANCFLSAHDGRELPAGVVARFSKGDN